MQYPYSGSDDETPESNLAGGGPSSILHAPGENTLRKNFQAIQERNEAIAAQQELQAQRAAAAEAAANGRHGIMPPPRDPDKREKRASRKEDANLPDVPPSRPPLPHRLDQQPGSVTPPHPPPQRPLPPPPGQSEPLRRDDGRKPSTPPSREHRNSRILQPPQQRKPEELDVLAAQLNELASSPRNGRQAQQQRQRQSGAGQADRNNGHPPHQRPIVEDDSSDDDEDAVMQRDGTLQVNDPVSRPLRELGAGGQARKGPGRPLPPTPDDDNSDSMRRASQGHRMEAAQARGGVMPDLLPQQSSGGSGPNTPVSRMTEEGGVRGVGVGGGMQEKQKSFLGFGFGEGGPGGGGGGGTPPTGLSGDGASPGGARREISHVPSVNVTPVSHDISQDTPEIRKYKKRFNSEILCAALWGVNLLIGTENGLMLLDRSGQGKVYQLISRRRFQQMEVLEGQNILVTISGKSRK